MIYKIYQVKCKVNHKIYVGVHKCPTDCKHKVNDVCMYMGSGTVISKALKKYGKASFEKEILFEFKTRKEALEKEIEIVDEKFVMREDTYNKTLGGGQHAA